jgi:type VI protein secretion system component VasF
MRQSSETRDRIRRAEQRQSGARAAYKPPRRVPRWLTIALFALIVALLYYWLA